MKIAVFSDVQGNLPGMETVVAHILDWKPDLVIMNGDLVNRGPSSERCLALFEELRQDRGWLPVRGNHEDYVLYCGEQPPTSDLDAAMRRFADWTAAQLGSAAESLRDWPDHLALHGPNDTWVQCTHGSLLGNRDGISRSVTDAALAERVPAHADLFLVAHTHKPLIRRFGSTRIVNVGSAGSPFDGDPRASYARLTWKPSGWSIEIVRLDYDRERADKDFSASGFLDHGGPLAGFVHTEWRRAELLMPRFRERYLDALRTGAISLDSAVDAFLKNN